MFRPKSNSAVKNEKVKSEKEVDKTADKTDKKSADTEKPKELKETKKETKPSPVKSDKNGAKQKTAVLIFEIPKNKSSGAKTREKT
jgi:hypothetical protein